MLIATTGAASIELSFSFRMLLYRAGSNWRAHNNSSLGGWCGSTSGNAIHWLGETLLGICRSELGATAVLPSNLDPRHAHGHLLAVAGATPRTRGRASSTSPKLRVPFTN